MSFKSFVTQGYAEGQTIRALAAATGKSYGTVRSALVAEGVPLRRRGNRRGTAMMPVGDARARREELSAELLRARLASGLTGAAAGERAGISQSKVSKVETGRLLPKLADVERLAEVYQVTPEVRRRLVGLTQEVIREAAHRRAVLHRGVARRQIAVARAQAAARVVRVLAVSTVPVRLLARPEADRHLVVLLSESALRSNPDHWGRLRESLFAPGVEIGVIPWYARVDVPDAGFQVYDEAMVVFDLLAGNVVITDPDDVRGHIKTFEGLRRGAFTGPKLHAHLDAVATDYRRVAQCFTGPLWTSRQRMRAVAR